MLVELKRGVGGRGNPRAVPRHCVYVCGPAVGADTARRGKVAWKPNAHPRAMAPPAMKEVSGCFQQLLATYSFHAHL